MLRRWLIRVPCLLALAFVVGVWIASYFGRVFLSKNSGGRFWSIGTVQGLVYMDEDGSHPWSPTPLQLYCFQGVTARECQLGPTTLGFYGGRWPGWRDSLQIVFPLWLPTLLLAGLNWFVWRKTRAKYNGRGFPVEPVSAKDKGAAESPRGA